MASMFHLLHTDIAKPRRFTYPFCYEPHPLAVTAAEAVRRHISGNAELRAEADKGKMFGVLVAEDADGRTGFLAAYSGLIGNRHDRSYFVPPIVDTTAPDGYFKVHEAEITALNKEIEEIENAAEYIALIQRKDATAARARHDIESYKIAVGEARARRHDIRRRQTVISTGEREAMLNESRYMNAQLRRIKRQGREDVAVIERLLAPYQTRIDRLRARRKTLSDSLQQWLFDRYDILNARGERRSLCSIFAATAGKVPPSGAGDCCAPKLLQYAYGHGYRPVCMAEFWWGESPKNEIRHHGRYYTACRGKCKPILTHMLQGLDVDPDPQMTVTADEHVEVLYDDDAVAVINKPAGLLSVPGRGDGGTESNRRSVLHLMRDRYPEATGPMIVHRLDMDTSGVMIIAKDEQTYASLQKMFAGHKVKKRYVALLEKQLPPAEGTISLPLRPDPLNRPMQMADTENGKEAVTDYKITAAGNGRSRVTLYPRTGRTHQLRVHCAHADGLNAPIAGDNLYGHPGTRLFLHAEAVEFTHPVTGKTIYIEKKAPF